MTKTVPSRRAPGALKVSIKDGLLTLKTTEVTLQLTMDNWRLLTETIGDMKQ